MAADFTYKISGTVTYASGGWAPFEASIQNGLLHNPYGAESLAAFAQAYASTAANKSTEIDALCALFVGPTHTLSPAIPVADDETVTDFTMEISGMIAFADNVQKYFAAQYSMGSGWLIADELLDTGVALVYDTLISIPAWNALVQSGLEVLCGAGNATVTT